MINIKKIILISGKAGSGKDSTANILKQKLESKNNKVLITHMADLLKYIVKTYFNWNSEKDEVGRHILQYIGTDVIRKQNPNYWIDFVKGILTMFEGVASAFS
jgi:tRNA uridine 5-carbamoylmethylation protein Kti12